jgi:PAS domain S-box-containing protein
MAESDSLRLSQTPAARFTITYIWEWDADRWRVDSSCNIPPLSVSSPEEWWNRLSGPARETWDRAFSDGILSGAPRVDVVYCTSIDKNSTWHCRETASFFRDETGRVLTVAGQIRASRTPSPSRGFLHGLNQLLTGVATGEPLESTLDSLARLIDAESPGVRSTILLLDEEAGTLSTVAAPGMPPLYRNVTTDFKIGPSAGSCGTAAYRKEPVIVCDARESPLFAGLEDFVKAIDFRASWSAPIFGPRRRVLGTFAMYRHEPGEPTDADWDLIERCTNVAAVAIEHHQKARALLASESRLRMLIESTRTVPWEYDLAAQQFTFVGQQAMELLGYTVEEWLQPGFWASVLHPEDRDAAIAYCTEETYAGNDHSMVYRMKHRDGNDVWVLDLGSRIPNSSRPRAVGFMVNISRQKEIEHERHRLEEQLRNSQRLESVGLLAGGIAHDFNNLLTPILSFAGMIVADAPPDSETGRSAASIIDAAQRAAELCQQLLAYAGNGPVRVGRIKLNDTIRRCRALLSHAVARNADLRFELTDPLPRIEADESQLQQILFNTVINAGESLFGVPGVVTVKSSTRHVTAPIAVDAPSGGELQPGDYVVLSVHDTGVGMTDEVRSRIFDPFYSTKFTGRGMGLAAVAGILRRANGGVVVTSSAGFGTRFDIYFPVCTASDSSGEIPVDQVDESATTSGPDGAVLVIDDEPAVRVAIARVLEAHGARLFLGGNVAEGLQLLGAHRNAIGSIFVDFAMPDGSGIDFIREAHAIAPEIPIVLMSGYTSALLPTEPLLNKIAAFLAKPFTPDQLVGVWKSCAGANRSRPGSFAGQSV